MCITEEVFFKGQLCLRFGAFGSEAGCEWGEVSNQQAKGSEGGGGRMLALAAFWLLGGYRCAALALLQTHSALSASSSERCNSK